MIRSWTPVLSQPVPPPTATETSAERLQGHVTLERVTAGIIEGLSVQRPAPSRSPDAQTGVLARSVLAHAVPRAQRAPDEAATAPVHNDDLNNVADPRATVGSNVRTTSAVAGAGGSLWAAVFPVVGAAIFIVGLGSCATADTVSSKKAERVESVTTDNDVVLLQEDWLFAEPAAGRTAH